MFSRKNLGFFSFFSLLAIGFYYFRRYLLSRFLHLRPPRYNVSVRRGTEIPMLDGVILVADHYIPKGKGLFPTILMRTPYGRNAFTGSTGFLVSFAAQRFSERGYNVIVQDVRGRFYSGSEFEPFVHESSDGKATVKWIEQQPWFNGILGTWGPSYLGYVQWVIAPDAPPYFKTMMPVISGSQLPFIGIRDRAFNLDTTLRWIIALDTLDRKLKIIGWFRMHQITSIIQDRIVKKAASHLPLGESDLVAIHKEVNFFRSWMSNPSKSDSYWRALDRGSEHCSITAQVHLVGGWYDILIRETLSDYLDLVAVGHRPYLTIGPWSHLMPDGQVEALRQGIIWFDAYLKGDRRELREKPVSIFMMGDEHWQEFESWPPLYQEEKYYLHNAGMLSSQDPQQGEPPDDYTYDPSNPTPSLGGHLMSTEAGPKDNRKLEARPDVLTFTTAPLIQDFRLIGYLKLYLYILSDLEYTDFVAPLCDVFPGGPSMNICDGILRLEPGIGETQLDGSLLIQIDLWPTAYCFKVRHRIRLQVSSGAHPRWNRNLGSGEPIKSAITMIPAHQTVYHDAAHPSALILPVLE